VAEEEVEGVSEEGVCLITHDNQPGGVLRYLTTKTYILVEVEALVGYNQ
jgi:hypothetical protein